MKSSTILSCLALIALCACCASAAPLPPPDHGHAPSARPVEAIDARLSFPGNGIHPVQFKPGTVRVRLPSGSIDLGLDELLTVRYHTAAPEQDSSRRPDPDECTIGTVHGDVISGLCPYREFRKLIRATGPAVPDTDTPPSAISFVRPDSSSPADSDSPAADVGAPWTITLSNGSLLHMRPVDSILRFEGEDGPIPLPSSLLSSLLRDSGTDLLDIRLADAPYAIRSYLPRAALQVSAGKDRTLSIPWSDIVSVSHRVGAATDPVLHAQRVAATFDGPSTRAVPVEGTFPVSFLSLRTPVGDLSIPSTRIERIERNSDRTHTVVTVSGDILTGRLSLTDRPIAPPADSKTFPLAEAASIRFLDHAEPDVPDDALVWRLSEGDILVASRILPGDAQAANHSDTAATATPVPVGRISAVRPHPGAAASPRAAVPQPAADGTWPEKRYSIRLVSTAQTLDIPSKSLEAVRPLPVSALPPAIIPTSPSAFASDEVHFPGGEFHLGRSAGPGPSDEIPSAFIRLAPYWLANTPVTVAQFRAFVDDTGYCTSAERMPGLPTWKTPGFTQNDDHPVVCISWLDAAQYCNWRSKRARLSPAYDIRDDGRRVILRPEADGYRLPIEAEWEYAARNGGLPVVFPWGDDDSEEAALSRANFDPLASSLDPWPNTNPVKAFPAAPSGLFGMAGNVCEWCQDMYDANAYASAYRIGDISSLLNPDSREFGDARINRVIRGGSYRNPLSSLRCTARAYGPAQAGAPHVGFRLARNAD